MAGWRGCTRTGAWTRGGRQITRCFRLSGFAQPAQLVNLVVWHAGRSGHHPDITFGWGYVRISYATHDIGGLPERDFDCARALDRLLS